jgi:uncharacterized protein YkwD
MKSVFLLLILAISAMGQTMPVSYRLTASRSTATAITPAAARALERDAFQLINTERGLAGLNALKWNDQIAEVARLHSANMARYDFFSHQGLDGKMVDDRAGKLGLYNWSAIGENIAFMKGYDDPVNQAVQRWLQSPGHKKNLLGPDWTQTGIGLSVTADGKYYFTQVFIRD